MLLGCLLTLENAQIEITILLGEPPLLHSDVSPFLEGIKQLGS